MLGDGKVRALAVVLFVASVADALAAMWWWALLGMAKPVGTAHIVTVMTLALMAAMAAVMGDE